MVTKENIDKDKVMLEIKKIGGNKLYRLQEKINDWAEGSMAESPIYEVATVEETENETEIAKEIIKQLVDNFEEYKEQVEAN